MSKIVEKKVWPKFFREDKKSRFDLRLADFGLKGGDVIRFREWNPKARKFTGREFKRKVKSVVKFGSPTRFWKKKDLERRGLYLIELGKLGD